jgi:ATP-dependent DNA ligase
MTLPVTPPVSPMLAKLVRELPTGDGLLYEPKWDGFRCIVFRDGDEIELGSRNERPFNRYFPELVENLRGALPERAVLDGEIVIATEQGLDFDRLQMRIHPAASRVAKLAAETSLPRATTTCARTRSRSGASTSSACCAAPSHRSTSPP